VVDKPGSGSDVTVATWTLAAPPPGVLHCFSSGRGVAHFWFSVSTLNETDYPFAPSGSKRAGVTVGPHNAGRPC